MLSARYGIEREAGADLSDPLGALRDDKKLDGDQRQKEEQSDRELVTHRESADAFNELAGAPLREDRARCANVEREAEGREREDELRERREDLDRRLSPDEEEEDPAQRELEAEEEVEGPARAGREEQRERKGERQTCQEAL